MTATRDEITEGVVSTGMEVATLAALTELDTT